MQNLLASTAVKCFALLFFQTGESRLRGLQHCSFEWAVRNVRLRAKHLHINRRRCLHCCFSCPCQRLLFASYWNRPLIIETEAPIARVCTLVVLCCVFCRCRQNSKALAAVLETIQYSHRDMRAFTFLRFFFASVCVRARAFLSTYTA